MKTMRLVDRIWVAVQVIQSRAVSVTQEWDQHTGRRTTLAFDDRMNFDRMPMMRSRKSSDAGAS